VAGARFGGARGGETLPSGEINESLVRQVTAPSDAFSPTLQLLHPPLTGITAKGLSDDDALMLCPT